jgi:nucleoside-diphosphate-sugar epimerase
MSASCQSALSVEEGGGWDYVINCACETKSGQTDPVYKEGILKLSLNCATEAAKLNVKRFVEVSSGHMCSANKVGFVYVLPFNQFLHPHLQREKFHLCKELILHTGKH